MSRPLCDRCEQPADYHAVKEGADYCKDHALALGVLTEPGGVWLWNDIQKRWNR